MKKQASGKRQKKKRAKQKEREQQNERQEGSLYALMDEEIYPRIEIAERRERVLPHTYGENESRFINVTAAYICASVLVYENDPPRFGPSGIVFPHMHHNSIPYQRQHASHAVHPLFCCVHVENEEEKYLDYN